MVDFGEYFILFEQFDRQIDRKFAKRFSAKYFEKPKIENSKIDHLQKFSKITKCFIDFVGTEIENPSEAIDFVVKGDRERAEESGGRGLGPERHLPFSKGGWHRRNLEEGTN